MTMPCRDVGDAACLTVGDRIELIAMPDEPDPLPVGSKGTVAWVNTVTKMGPPFVQVSVKWDCGRTLMLSIPPDQAGVVTD